MRVDKICWRRPVSQTEAKASAGCLGPQCGVTATSIETHLPRCILKVFQHAIHRPVPVEGLQAPLLGRRALPFPLPARCPCPGLLRQRRWGV